MDGIFTTRFVDPIERRRALGERFTPHTDVLLPDHDDVPPLQRVDRIPRKGAAHEDLTQGAPVTGGYRDFGPV